jgi:hypothetical protein
MNLNSMADPMDRSATSFCGLIVAQPSASVKLSRSQLLKRAARHFALFQLRIFGRAVRVGPLRCGRSAAKELGRRLSMQSWLDLATAVGGYAVAIVVVVLGWASYHWRALRQRELALASLLELVLLITFVIVVVAWLSQTPR